jgi:hypothetical protein
MAGTKPRRDIVANQPMHQLILDDAITAQCAAARLELRLDECHEPGAGRRKVKRRRQSQLE